jgi:hypothetical protein
LKSDIAALTPGVALGLELGGKRTRALVRYYILETIKRITIAIALTLTITITIIII